MRRFTRLSMGFSKKVQNLAAAVAFQAAYYNFCWRLRRPGKSGQLTPTPAMMAGLTDTLWTLDDLYDAVMKQQADKKHHARIEKLLKSSEVSKIAAWPAILAENGYEEHYGPVVWR